MGSWNDIFREIQNTKSQYDYVRRKYLSNLCDFTGRNAITYYSAWLSKPDVNNIDINDNDINGFMACIYKMDCSKGLDLILHTPGGNPTAAEAIVNYLRDKFDDDIRVIVPQIAMSAGTMIACAAKEIVMGKQSSLGPIDPQFNGIPAYNIKLEYEEAKKDLLDNPGNAPYWAIKLQQYPAAFMKTAIDAIELSEQLVRDWLGSCMFNAAIEQDRQTIHNIVSFLNEHENSKTHGRHFKATSCRDVGLKIIMMEDDQELQDKVLSLHHAYMISLDATPIVKIIECQNDNSVVSTVPNNEVRI
ncbi:MAG: hypothetical protein J6O04_02310 [Selenomonadaceae bacterium]|nr:hypothetical protein [Selenomonadaceae bacterium]